MGPQLTLSSCEESHTEVKGQACSSKTHVDTKLKYTRDKQPDPIWSGQITTPTGPDDGDKLSYTKNTNTKITDIRQYKYPVTTGFTPSPGLFNDI